MKVAPWIIAVVASVVAVGVLVWALNRGRNATRDLAAERESRVMEIAGLNVAHQVDRDALMNDLVAEATASAALSAELARIQAAVPGAKPIATAHGSTPWKPVGPAAGGAAIHPPANPSGTLPPVPASCPPCRLLITDELQVRAGGAVLETELGNYAVAAAASVWRRPAGGGPEEQLHSEPLKLAVSIPERAAAPGWAFGPMAGFVATAGGGGWYVGAIAATPPVRLLFGLDGALVAGGGGGPNGVATGWVAAMLR